MSAAPRVVRFEPALTAGRAPPADLDAEAAVLAACMLHGPALDDVADVLRPEHFYSDANAAIWTAALALHATSSPVDHLSVCSWLRERERLGAVGGPSYVVQIADATPSVAHVAAHAATLIRLHRRRALIAACQRIAAEGYGDVGDADEWMADCEAAVSAVVQDRADDSTATMREALIGVYSRLVSGASDKGLASGLTALDNIIVGMKAGQLVIVAAGTSIGKSALALNVAVNVYTRPPIPASPAREATTTDPAVPARPAEPKPVVLIFSAEMTRDELAERALFSIAQVDASKLVDHSRITQADWGYLAEAAKYVGRDNCLIDDRVDLSPLAIRAKARRVAAQCRKAGTRLALIIVDYIQLLNGRAGMPRDATREAEVSGIGRALKNVAKEVDCPVVALSQLNDDAAKRAPRKGRNGEAPEPPRPRMSDLRESKAIGMHADKVILIHNPHADARAASGDAPPESEEVELIVGKNRGGRKGTARVTFWPQYTLFADTPAGGAS